MQHCDRSGQSLLCLPLSQKHPGGCTGLVLPLNHTFHSTWVYSQQTRVLGLAPDRSPLPWLGPPPLPGSLTVMPGPDTPPHPQVRLSEPHATTCRPAIPALQTSLPLLYLSPQLRLGAESRPTWHL